MILSTLFTLKFTLLCLIVGGVNGVKGVEIIVSKEFTSSDEVFPAQYVYLKNEDLSKVEHKISICEEDIKRPYQSNDFHDSKQKSL